MSKASFLLSLILSTLSAPLAADQSAPALAAYFGELKTRTDPDALVAAERGIWRLWKESNNEQAEALLKQGMAQVEQWEFEAALATFDDVITRAPGFAEAWNQRASLRYLMNDYDASLADIETTLRLEPRHFGALAGRGEILLKTGNLRGALEAFEQALAVHPHLRAVKLKVKWLRAQLE